MSDRDPTNTLEYRRPDLKRRRTPRDLVLILLRSALCVTIILAFAYVWLCWNVYHAYSLGPTEGGDVMLIAIAGVRTGTAIGVAAVVCVFATFVSRRR